MICGSDWMGSVVIVGLLLGLWFAAGDCCFVYGLGRLWFGRLCCMLVFFLLLWLYYGSMDLVLWLCCYLLLVIMMVMVYYDLLSLVDGLVGGFGFGGLCLLCGSVGCVSVLVSSDGLGVQHSVCCLLCLVVSSVDLFGLVSCVGFVWFGGWFTVLVLVVIVVCWKLGLLFRMLDFVTRSTVWL